MNFSTILHPIASRPELADHYLTDGLLTCYYPDIPGLLTTLDNYLSSQGISPDECIALECINSVPGALSILLMLYRRQGFVLLPPSEKGEELSQLKPIPGFCSRRIRVMPVSGDAVERWQNDPACYLTVDNHAPSGTDPLLPPDDIRGRLFLRTSGSMGTAKLVVHSHEGLLGNADNVRRKYGFSPEDRATIPVPIFHMYGMGAELLPALLAGASIDLQQNTNLIKYLDRERRFKPTIAFVTPNLVEMLLQGKRTPTPYRVMVVSGQRFPQDLFRAFDPLCGGRLVNQYGSSEMGAIAACEPDDPFELRLSSIGRPMPDVDLRLENREEGIGELYCHHPYAYLGYMSEEGAWISRASEWHRTGDIGRSLDNGLIEVLGRADDSVNRSGYLILLADVERLMATLPGIARATVLATREVQRMHGQQIVAFCQPTADAVPDVESIRQAALQIMPPPAVPDKIHLLDKLPLLPSGKIDRQTLLLFAGE